MPTPEQLAEGRKRIAEARQQQLLRYQSITFPLDPAKHVARLRQADTEDHWHFLGGLVCHAINRVNIIPVKQFRKEPEEFIESKGWTDSDEIKDLIRRQPEGSSFLLFPTHCHEEPRLYLPSESGKGGYSFPVLYCGQDGWTYGNYYASIYYGLQKPFGAGQSTVLEMDDIVVLNSKGTPFPVRKYRLTCGSLATWYYHYPEYAMAEWKTIIADPNALTKKITS